MMIPLFLLLTALYVAGIGYLLYYWWKIAYNPLLETSIPESIQLSVVIVVRNEEENIVNLLKDLEEQTFRTSAFEVLIVNDHSHDNTCRLIEEVGPTLPFSLRLLHGSGVGKKAGLELGIGEAEGEIIAVTDGDCRLPKDWLQSIYGTFIHQKSVFVSGPVTFSGEKNLFEKLQTIEFASLVGAGAALLQAGKPGMCNAANMAFRKEAFDQVNAFQKNRHIPSGDDEFLLQAIFKEFPGKVHYLKAKGAVVRTGAQQSWQTFFHQRKRWAGKWRLHKNPWVSAIAVGVYLFHTSWVLLLGVILLNQSGFSESNSVLPFGFFFMAILVKFGSEFLFLQTVLRSMSKKLMLFPFLLLQLLYPFYVMFFGIAVNFGSFSWKGRIYKYTNT